MIQVAPFRIVTWMGRPTKSSGKALLTRRGEECDDLFRASEPSVFWYSINPGQRGMAIPLAPRPSKEPELPVSLLGGFPIMRGHHLPTATLTQRLDHADVPSTPDAGLGLDPAQQSLGDRSVALAVLGNAHCAQVAVAGAGSLKAQGFFLLAGIGSHLLPHRPHRLRWPW